MDDWDDDSFVCTALNGCFCRSCRSEQVNIQERYMLIGNLSNTALDVLARHDIPAAVAPTNDGYQLICLPRVYASHFAPLFQMHNPCSRHFSNAQRHIAITVMSLIGHSSFWFNALSRGERDQAARPGNKNGRDIGGSSKKKGT